MGGSAEKVRCGSERAPFCRRKQGEGATPRECSGVAESTGVQCASTVRMFECP